MKRSRFVAAGALVVFFGLAASLANGEESGLAPPLERSVRIGIANDNEPTAPGASDFLETGKKLYSQNREEVVIRDFFQDRRDGIFVDVGCAFPIQYSTTYFLEKHLDWSGLGIDAVASYAELWEAQRPRSKFLNYFVTNRSGKMEKLFETGYRPVSSGTKEMVKGLVYKEVRVPGSTLNDILKKNSIEKIDFLSMDIEGGQLPALRGFDIKKYRPDLVCIEDYIPDRAKIFEYFEKNGYDLLNEYVRFDWTNWYFAPKNRAPRKPWEPPARDPTTSVAEDGLPVGSYRQTCKDCRWEGDALACECQLMTGEYAPARVNTPCVRGYSNKGGRLTCEG